MKWSFLFGASIAFASWMPASAQLISDPNIFNTGTNQATITMSTEYSDGTFPHEQAVDLGSAQVYFGDYMRGGTNPSSDVQLMTISGFSAASGIDSIRFYRGNYEDGRVADQVTVYYSLSNTTSQSPSAFIALNGGNPYTLPLTGPEGGYLNASASGPTYDTLTGLNIPLGAQSVLLDFGPERDGYGAPGDTYYVGVGFTEIQAFSLVPEPSTYLMIGVGLIALAGFSRVRKCA